VRQAGFRNARGWREALYAVAAVGLLALAPVVSYAQAPAQPEAPTAPQPRRAAVVGTKHMAVAANPLAAEAGREILRAGGSAIDAAIAMQMVLTLVEPQSSGIGGGGFLLHYDASRKTIITYDGRETAPAGATPEMFLGPDGNPIPFAEASVGGHAVGTPGLVRMLEMAHREYGRLPWHRLFEPAMRLAEGGFAVSPRLHALIVDTPQLKEMPGTRVHFYDRDGKPHAIGAWIYNPSLFETFRLIANGGSDAFYRGQVARDIVATVSDPAQQGDPAQVSREKAQRRAGKLSLADLALYRAIKREPVCVVYRGLRVCGMGPPSSGGIAVAQILLMLERFSLRGFSPGSLEAVHLISEAQRLAFADRNRYIADADMMSVPVRALTSHGYLDRRSELILPWKAMGRAEPGRPLAQHILNAPALDTTREIPATSHLSAVDSAGNAVSLTSSIENQFGARLFVRGFLLNNQMTDFALKPTDEAGHLAINRVEPGKRPRSSMSPTLVLDRERRLVMTLGSPGGARIIAYVSQALIGAIDWRLDMQRAFDLPHHANLNGKTQLEDGTGLTGLVDDLQKLGHEIEIVPMTSGLHGIAVVRRGDKIQLVGGADPRREGLAAGD
jgi:gamma-glutamyltranspeptidase / glutathione hydrolase